MTLSQNLKQIQKLIKQTELEYSRTPGSVLLLAVSKHQSVELIKEAFQLGVTHFGESYFQEAQQKINELKTVPLCWHFIGPIQSNKTRGIASSFSWVHSISRYKIACQLNKYRPPHLGPINICLQINLMDEKTKSGISPEHAPTLALEVSQLPNLRLRGLMTILPEHTSQRNQYHLFMQLNQLMHSLNHKLKLDMDNLSMGMSDSLIPAIEAGATVVRIGQAIFGVRESTVKN